METARSSTVSAPITHHHVLLLLLSGVLHHAVGVTAGAIGLLVLLDNLILKGVLASPAALLALIHHYVGRRHLAHHHGRVAAVSRQLTKSRCLIPSLLPNSDHIAAFIEDIWRNLSAAARKSNHSLLLEVTDVAGLQLLVVTKLHLF